MSIINSQKRACVQGYPVDLLTMEEATSLVDEYINSQKSAHIVTVNPEMIEQGSVNPELEEILKEAEIVIPDGIGVVIALRLMGLGIKRLPGIELASNLVAMAEKKNYKVAFLGAEEAVIQKATDKLLKMHPNLQIVYKHNGYFDKDEERLIVEEIKNTNPDLLFVGLGVPAQEIFIFKYKKNLSRTIMVGIGGSFDVWASKVKRAPIIYRKMGLEWFYRLITQPSRFKRMFPTLPLFLLRVLSRHDKNRKEY